MAGLKSTEELRAATQESIIEFLRTDLTTCWTFADLAESELSTNGQHALQSLGRGERGCEVIEHFVALVKDATQREEIEQKLGLLRSRLTAIRSESADSPSPRAT